MAVGPPQSVEHWHHVQEAAQAWDHAQGLVLAWPVAQMERSHSHMNQELHALTQPAACLLKPRLWLGPAHVLWLQG